MKKKLKFTLYLVLVYNLLFVDYVYAYVDPSVVSYSIQIIVGVAVVIGAGIGALVRKIKKKIKLDTTTNKNKEVESDDIIVNKKRK